VLGAGLALLAAAAGAADPPVDRLELHISVPATSDFRSMALGADQILRLESRVQVVTESGGPARIGNTGSAQTDVGSGSRVGDVMSVARVDVHERAQVVGDLVSAAS